MKKLTSVLLSAMMLSQSGFAFPLIASAEETNDALHFVMRVRWGNVLDAPQDSSEMNFDGSISASDVENSRGVRLMKALKFEKHNETADKITSRKNPVSWNSLTYGHWDGVIVNVSASPENTITTAAGATIITKTAQELYDQVGAFVQDVGNGREIVIDTHRVPAGTVLAEVDWGKHPRIDCKENPSDPACTGMDFTGSLTLENITTGKFDFLKTLRFEPSDSITSESETAIEWVSKIYGGRDGILLLITPDTNADAMITASFPAQNYTSSHSLNKLLREGQASVEIVPGYTLHFKTLRPSRHHIVKAVAHALEIQP